MTDLKRVLVLVLATCRLTRFFTTDWLGEWLVCIPARRWANSHDQLFLRAPQLLEVGPPGPYIDASQPAVPVQDSYSQEIGYHRRMAARQLGMPVAHARPSDGEFEDNPTVFDPAWLRDMRVDLSIDTTNDLEGPVTSEAGWRSKLVSGLDCPYCVGFWVGLAVLMSTRLKFGAGLRYRLFEALALNYVAAAVEELVERKTDEEQL
jgi:hypothetical protein